MEKPHELLRKLPKMDALLALDESKKHSRMLGHGAVLRICRAAVENAKKRALEQGEEPSLERISSEVTAEFRRARSNILGRVINGTGVMLHTNMGRAPLGMEIFSEMAEMVSGYCNLEINVLERRRGIRGPHVSDLLAQACDAEDALVLNNNAAAMFLILREFAAGRNVIISRGELVQIGGGFRIPDILESSGAALKEVGTTNITSTDDFSRAIDGSTGLILKVHHSNFRMDGFVDVPEVRDLAPLKTSDTLLVSDLGSGNLVRSTGHGATGEPTPADILSAGADLVCFSCDKMLGGVQAGVVAGRADLVERLRKNPVMRVLRVDKLAYAALQVALTHHLAGEHQKVALWGMAWPNREEIRCKAEDFIKANNLDPARYSVVDSEATFGGGSTPGEKIPSAAISVRSKRSPDSVARWFQQEEPPVVGTVKEGTFQVDFRTILPRDEGFLAVALGRFTESVE